MNKIQNLIAFAKDNKINIIKGTAIGLGATVGLAVGMDLMNRAVTSGEEALDDLTEGLDTSDLSTDTTIETD